MENILTCPLIMSLLKRKSFTKCFNSHLLIVGRGTSSMGSRLTKALFKGVKIVRFPASSNFSPKPTKSMSPLNFENAFLAAGLSTTSSTDLTLTSVAVFLTTCGFPDEKSRTKLSSSSSASFFFGLVVAVVVVVEVVVCVVVCVVVLGLFLLVVVILGVVVLGVFGLVDILVVVLLLDFVGIRMSDFLFWLCTLENEYSMIIFSDLGLRSKSRKS